MTNGPETPPPLSDSRFRRAWSRRWVRRITYVLASGAVLTGLVAWGLQQPAVDRWIIQRIDEALRKETGLSFQAERLEIHPFQGRVILHGPRVGGDLFQAQLLEVDVYLEPRALLQSHHLKRILVESPRINLDARRLASIHLRERPPSREGFTFALDRAEVHDGLALVDEPAWGLVQGSFPFTVDGRGRLPNQVWLDVKVPNLALGAGKDRATGAMSLKFRATDKGVDTANVQVRLGWSQVAVLGSYAFGPGTLKAETHGSVDLGEIQRVLPPDLRPGGAGGVSGQVDFQARAQGPVAAPAWNVVLAGRQLQAKGVPLRPGNLSASAAGSPSQLRLERFRWESSDGKVEGEGAWSRAGGTSLTVSAEGISLAPAAVYARTDVLKGLTGHFHGSATFPTPPWRVPDLEKVGFKGAGTFHRDGEKVGEVEISVAERRLHATALDLQLPEAGFHGSATALLNHKGIDSIQADGDVRTDAQEVAKTLDAWKVTHTYLDMAGRTQAQATLDWNARDGIRLQGRATVDDPRWHGAMADQVRAEVALTRDEIHITSIELDKGAGHGTGDIWISWADGPPGAEGIDMCFSAFRLPIQEGLKAADQGGLEISGTGSGWARLHGPLDAIVMEGQAVAEDGKVYGIALPAVSGSFFMDIDSLRLKATDVHVADTLDHLEGAPGPLDLRGSMDMDADKEVWTARISGQADSSLLGLEGPRIQAKVEGRLEGPLTVPLGPSQAPEGTLLLTDGRLETEGREVQGIQGSLSFQDGRLEGRVGFQDHPEPVLSFQGLQHGTSLDADLRLHLGPGTADVEAAAGRLTQGFLKRMDLDLEARGAWTPDGVAWRGELHAFKGVFEGFQLAQTQPATFVGDLDGVKLAMDLEGRTRSKGGTPSAHATTMRLEGWAPFAKDGRLDLRMNGGADLSTLKSIADHLTDPGQYSLMADLQLEGTASFDLSLHGRPAEPALDGRLNLSGGRLSVRTYPQSAEKVEFTALFHDREITIPQNAPLRGTLAQGALTAWGGVTWGFRGLSTYDLSATLEDFQWRDMPEGFTVQGSFNGSLRGNEKDGGLIKGTIRAKSMLYQTDFNITDIILAGAFGTGGGLTALDPSDPLTRIELDLDLRLSRPWELDTNLLKLQGRPAGSFRVLGNLARPGLKGRMDFLPGGRLTNVLPAGDMVLERGWVEFPDPAVFNPVLDLHGWVEVDPYLVNLDINGTLDTLSWRPSSTPALRPDEIFAILVDPSAVNKVGSSTATTSQAAASSGMFNQGAGLLTTLVLANGLDRLRKTLGLDRVNFSYTGPTLSLTLEKSFDAMGHRIPFITSYKQEGTQTTWAGNLEWRFGNLILQLGAKQITGNSQTPGDYTTPTGVQPSGEIRYTWQPK